ncbi:MAG TPA: class I SAM-dependent methyltransferase [Gemmatimonadales bacterium]|nr:class I SAM-dependent methyltransferase [Gemmatimonadales bacterium]
MRGDVKAERYAAYRGLSAVLRALGIPAHFKRRFKPQVDDIEAEVTYLLVRDARPAVAVEIAPDRGWSTTWLLARLRDNGTGHLYSYDIFDHATKVVPEDLSRGRWTFTLGDVTQPPDRLPASIDFLFLDAAHSAPFARWYLSALLPRLRPGTPVAIHDIFLPAERLDLFGESVVVREWLQQRGMPYFTASPAAARDAFDLINTVKQELGLAAPIMASQANPMLFFRM